VERYPALDITNPQPPRVKVTPLPPQSSATRFTAPKVASAANAWPVSWINVTKSLIGVVMMPAKGTNQSARVSSDANTSSLNEPFISDWVCITCYTVPGLAWFGLEGPPLKSSANEGESNNGVTLLFFCG